MLSRQRKVFWIKLVHTIIYFIMVASVLDILYAAITKTYDQWLYLSLGLLTIEVIVYFGNGMVCPFTDLAKKYGDKTGYVGDMFMPKKVADNTFYGFGALFVVGLIILVLNILKIR